MSRAATRGDLIAAIQGLADELGETPMLDDMREMGDYSAHPFYREFDTWGDALQAAGFVPYKNNSYTKEDLIKELQRVAEKLGRQPRTRDMKAHSKYSKGPFKNTFGNWSNALNAASLGQKFKHRDDVSDEEFINDLQNVADELGRAPTYREKSEYGTFPPGPIYHRFGGWNKALDRAGLDPNREPGLPDSDVLDELRRIAAELGHRPREIDLKEFGRFSHQLYVRRFGSWSTALEKAGFDPTKYVDRPNLDDFYGEGWNEEKREQVRRRDGYRCQGCGVDQNELEQRLDVHHIIPAHEFDIDRGRNAIGNLVSFCRPCHRRYEGTHLRPELVDR